MRIYTKTGDDGTTGLYGGSRRSKASVRIDSYGTIDELNSLIGVIRTMTNDGEIQSILAILQDQLFTVGADLASPAENKSSSELRVDEKMISCLERYIDTLEQLLPGLKNFILPHGDAVSSMLHLSRAVCRRAERLIVRLSQEENINLNIIIYVNRLSDLLFVLARTANRKAGREDTPWLSNKKNDSTF